MVGFRGVACTNSLGAGGDAHPVKTTAAIRDKNARRCNQSDIETPFPFVETV
jgi:hypothetical protein